MDETIGDKILQVWKPQLRGFWRLCERLVRSTSGLYRWLATKSDCLPPYAADGSLKSKENLELGLARAKDVLFNMYRTGSLVGKKTMKPMLSNDLTKDFIDPDGIEKTPHDYLYFQAMAEAKEAMYDYLIKRDNVTKQDLKTMEPSRLIKN